MSIKIMSAVFESKTLGPTERLIMLSLADHADGNGRCYPSVARLCQRTGLKERAVQVNIKALVQKGYLTIVPNAGQGLANLYSVRATPAADAPPQEMHPRTICTSAPAADAPPQEMHPRTICTSAPASDAQTPAADAPKPSLTIIEPSEEPPLVPPKAEAKRRRSPVPKNWQPNPTNIAHATAEGFTEKEIENEAVRFRDHHHAKGTVFADHDAAWRSWISNSRKYRGGGSLAGKADPKRGGQRASIASIALRNRTSSFGK